MQINLILRNFVEYLNLVEIGVKFPKIFGLDCSIKTHHARPSRQFFGHFVWELGGGTKRRGRAQCEFGPSHFGRKGGNFAAAACQLAAFSSKFFQTGRSAFLLSRATRRAELGGRIQCSVKEYS